MTKTHFMKNYLLRTVQSDYHGSESMSFLGPKVWNILLDS